MNPTMQQSPQGAIADGLSQLWGLGTAAIGLVVVGWIVAICCFLLYAWDNAMKASNLNTAVVANVTANSNTAMTNLASFLPIIAICVAAVIVLALIVFGSQATERARFNGG